MAAAAAAGPRAPGTSAPERAAGTRKPRRLAATAVLLVSLLLCFARFHTALPGPGRAFAGGRAAGHSQPSGDRRPRAVAMQANGKVHLRWLIQQSTGPRSTGITDIRPVPNRFGPQGTGDPRAASSQNEVYPSGPMQRYRFTQMNIAGHNVSEAFVRFPGRTPWKKIGELASKTGEFEEAIRVMWTILLKRSFYLYPKIRFWMPSDQPIEFGYADENANIVSVKDPLPEGIFPESTKKMMSKCGFIGIEKEIEYLPAKRNLLNRIGPQGLKKNWHMTGRMYLNYRVALRNPIHAQKWAQRALHRQKYQVKGTGIRQVDWFGGMGRWAAKSHFQRVAGSVPGGSVKKSRKQLKFPSGGKDNLYREWKQRPSLRGKRKPEGLREDDRGKSEGLGGWY